MLNRNISILALLLFGLLFTTQSYAADKSSLAETATNPIGSLIQVQLQDQYNWDNYNADGYSKEENL